MRIAILINHWKNSKGTGVTRYVLNLVNELQKHEDIQISVVYVNGDDQNNYKIRGNKFTYPFRVFLVLKKINPDILYIDNYWYYLLAGVLYRLRKKIIIVSTVHSYPSKLPIFGKYIMAYLMNSCNYITYVSNDLRIKIRDIWGVSITTKEEITYAGVQLPLVTNLEEKEFITRYNLPNDSIILLMQSSPIAKVKFEGTKILFDSINHLKMKYPEILLIITGDGPYLEELKNYASKLGIQNNIIFTGWLTNPIIPLSLCDLYVHISLGEGLPLSILEAMSAGKAIIATPVGGIPEVIENDINGILVEPDVNTISNSIDKLILNKELRIYLGNNAQFKSKIYTWKNCADKFVSIFRSLGE